jgi:hypothetical protein
VVELSQKNHDGGAPKGFWARYKDLWVPLGSLVVALITIQSTFFTTRMNNNLQLQVKQLDVQMKDYELNFKNKQEAYTSFMVRLSDSWSIVVANLPEMVNDKWVSKPPLQLAKAENDLAGRLADLETNYYRMEPFLNEKVRASTWTSLQEFQKFCEKVLFMGYTDDIMWRDSIRKYASFREGFRDQLYPSLFNQSLDKSTQKDSNSETKTVENH